MKTYFISGHRDASKEEFEKYYVPKLQELIKINSNKFVVGDCPGIDSFAIDYLNDNNIKEVTVYHIGTFPMYNKNFKTIGGFSNDFFRDYTMTLNSDEDVCWIKRLRSGTAMNIERRNWLISRKQLGLPFSYDDRIKIEANEYL